MKRLSPVLLGLALCGLAGVVGALLGFLPGYAIGRTGMLWRGLRHYPTAIQKLGIMGVVRIWGLSCEAGAAVGAIAGILIGAWLTRRLRAARKTG